MKKFLSCYRRRRSTLSAGHCPDAAWQAGIVSAAVALGNFTTTTARGAIAEALQSDLKRAGARD